MSAVSQDDSYDLLQLRWRTLALGIGALLAQRPERRRDPLSDLAQRLKSPVATLRAQAASLELQASRQSSAEVARCIVAQADVMSEWVSAILDVQRIRLGKLALDLQQVDLIELARACAQQVQESTGDVQITVASGAVQSQTVYADAGRLREVLVSVLQKAVTGASGGTVELRVDVADRIAITVCEPGTTCAFDDPLREPSGSLREPQDPRQTGQFNDAIVDLDLYVARELTRLHGGELWRQESAIVLVLPLDFSHRSHTVLARPAACSPTA
jgi:signal transduction histidine kinase